MEDTDRITVLASEILSVIHVTSSIGKTVGTLVQRLIDKGVFTQDEGMDILSEMIGTVLLDILTRLDNTEGT